MSFPFLKKEGNGIHTFLKKITGSDFVKNSAILTAGTVVAQVIPVLAMLVYARLYSDKSFGIYSLFFQLTAVLGSIANGRLEQPIVIEKEEETAARISKVSFSICLGFSLTVLVLMLLYQAGIYFFTINKDPLSFWKFLLPVSLAFSGMILQLSFVANRSEKYKRIALSKIVLTLVSNVVPIVIVFFATENEAGLIIGLLAGQVASLFYLSHQTGAEYFPALPSKNDFKAVWEKYKNYPLVNTPSILVDQLAAALPLLFITYYFSEAEAGQFSMASRILIVPSVFVAASVAQVFFKKASDSLHSGQGLKKITINTFAILLGAGFVFFSVVIFFGQQLIPYVLGGKWQLSGHIAKWLAISMILRFAISPVSGILVITNKLKLLAVWQISNLLVNLALACITVKMSTGLLTYILFLMVSDVIMYFLYFVILFRTVNSFERINNFKTGLH